MTMKILLIREAPRGRVLTTCNDVREYRVGDFSISWGWGGGRESGGGEGEDKDAFL